MPMSIKKLINNFAVSMMAICVMAVASVSIPASAQDNKLLEDTPNEAKAQAGATKPIRVAAAMFSRVAKPLSDAHSAYVFSLALSREISIRLGRDL